MATTEQNPTLEELLEQFKQLPDWDKYPLPEVFYTKYNLPKPKPSLSLMESLAYQVPPHQSLNKNGKVEVRPPAEGGVREIKEFMTLPVEQTLIKDENDDDSPQDSVVVKTILPIEDNKTESQPLLGHQSPDPSCDGHDNAPDAPCPDAECSPASPLLQNE